MWAFWGTQCTVRKARKCFRELLLGYRLYTDIPHVYTPLSAYLVDYRYNIVSYFIDAIKNHYRSAYVGTKLKGTWSHVNLSPVAGRRRGLIRRANRPNGVGSDADVSVGCDARSARHRNPIVPGANALRPVSGHLMLSSRCWAHPLTFFIRFNNELLSKIWTSHTRLHWSINTCFTCELSN